MIPKKIKLTKDNQEFTKSILPGLPTSLYSSTFSSNTYDYVDWHWHEAFQFCIVTEGTTCFQVANNHYDVSAGNGIFINYQQVHMSKSADGEQTSYLCLDIPPSFLCSDTSSIIYLKYLSPILDNPTPAAITLSSDNADQSIILEKIKDIQDILQRNKSDVEIDVNINALKIWKYTMKLMKRDDNYLFSHDQVNDRLKVILKYINDNYRENITLEMIAKHVSLSRSECCRFFQRATGQSLFSYLTTLRINKSMELLRSTDMKLSDIAHDVGFCNQSYYTKCFRQEKGITPRKFRELSARIPRGILESDLP